MMNSRLRTFLAAMACLLVILGCVVPGLSPESAPAPTVDSVLLVTMIAQTVAAAQTATAGAMPPIPTSTPTLVPPAETATPTVEGSFSGSILTKRDDGTTLFSDQLASYGLIVPAGWLPVRIKAPEYAAAWTLAETSDPAIQSVLKSIETEDPNRLRLFVVDTQDGHVQGGVATTIKFQWDKERDVSLADEADLLAISDTLTTETPGLEVVTTELRRTSIGVPLGVITTRTPTVKGDGSVLVIFEEHVFADLPQGTLNIILSTTEDFKDTVLPAFDNMLETLAINS